MYFQVLIDKTLWNSHYPEITLLKSKNLQNCAFLIEFWHFFRFLDAHKIFPSKPKCLVFPVCQSLLGVSWRKKLSNAHKYRKIQKMLLKAENEKWRASWKIQNAIKSKWKEELGWIFQDLLFSIISTNGQNLKQIGGYQFQTLGEVDWDWPYN